MQSQDIAFRLARDEDLPSIIQMLADDPMASKREDASETGRSVYQAAFRSITSDSNNELVVAVADQRIVGVLQITYIPNLTFQGSWRAQIEGVRVASDLRSAGIGRLMMEWSIDRARDRGCIMVQLTTDKSRPAALRFYEKLGFVASHQGMKLNIGSVR